MNPIQIHAPNNGGAIGGGGNMMDMVRSQLMTMMMVSSMAHGPQQTGSDSTSKNPMMMMIYITIATAFIDFLMKYAPIGAAKIVNYYADKASGMIKLDELISATSNGVVKEETASITLTIDTSKPTDIIGQAVLHHVTNHKNAQHVSHKNQSFFLDQVSAMELYDDIFGKLMHSDAVDASTSSTHDKKLEIIQTIKIFSYSKTLPELRDFLARISHEYQIETKNKIGNKIYYFSQCPINAPLIMRSPAQPNTNSRSSLNCPSGNSTQATGMKDFSKLPPTFIFSMMEFQTTRKFSNLFGPEIDQIRKRVVFFLNNRSWYEEKGIPYTLGFLLSGQAGAGKTSTIKCLAKESGRHIININLNNDMTKSQLENLFFNETLHVLDTQTRQTTSIFIPLNKRLYILEDIDCQTDIVFERANKPVREAHDVNAMTNGMPEQVDLSFLLNLLDGVLETPGRMLVMTCNYPEKLDHALIRPGRVDVVANFKKCTSKTIIEMIEFFYNTNLSDCVKATITDMDDFIISPAELGKFMFEDFESYANVIDKLEVANQQHRKHITGKAIAVATVVKELFIEYVE